MKIAVTGSSGLVGSALVSALEQAGHRVIRLVRRTPAGDGTEVLWDPDLGTLDAPALNGVEGVVHLAGESIASGRWTSERKDRIRETRVRGTRLLAEALAGLKTPPQVLVSASAIGYYGNRGSEMLREESRPGTGFLSEVCQEWEMATLPAFRKGIRIVNLRFGMILSPKGGALAKMLLPFRLGAGGVVGNGRQYWSWITLGDAVGALLHCLAQGTVKGPVNAVSPQTLTNHDFTKILGRVLHRPTICPMPALAARLAFGEMADALLLASARVEPARLIAGGYRFRHPELEMALCDLLGNPLPELC